MFAAPLSGPPRSRKVLAGRNNAHKFAGTTARRYVVHACVMEGGHILHAQVDGEPPEELPLPLTRDAATEFVLEHFGEMIPARLGELVALLTKPTGARARRPTDPLAGLQ